MGGGAFKVPNIVAMFMADMVYHRTISVWWVEQLKPLSHIHDLRNCEVDLRKVEKSCLFVLDLVVYANFLTKHDPHTTKHDPHTTEHDTHTTVIRYSYDTTRFNLI